MTSFFVSVLDFNISKKVFVTYFELTKHEIKG